MSKKLEGGWGGKAIDGRGRIRWYDDEKKLEGVGREGAAPSPHGVFWLIKERNEMDEREPDRQPNWSVEWLMDGFISFFDMMMWKYKPMLNPNSYAIITGKNQWGIQTDRDLQGTLTCKAATWVWGELHQGSWQGSGWGSVVRAGLLTSVITCMSTTPLLWYFVSSNMSDVRLLAVLNLLGTFTWNLLLETLEPPTMFAWNLYIFGTWEPFLGTVACLEPSLKIFGLEPWNLGTSCILKLELLEVSPGTCLEPFNHDKPKPSYMEQCWNLKTPATFQNLLGTAEPLGTSTWNLEPFDTFWNLHLEPVLETRNLYWMLAWNFRAFRNLAFTWNPLLEPLLGTLTWNLGTWNLLEFWNFPEPFLGSLSCLEPSLETWPWTSTWTP